MIFQLQFSLLQPPQLQSLMANIADQGFDHRIQIAMFHFKFDDAALNVFGRNHFLNCRIVLVKPSYCTWNCQSAIKTAYNSSEEKFTCDGISRAII